MTIQALEGNFDEVDRLFYECEPSINDLLEEYLKDNESEFLDIEF